MYVSEMKSLCNCSPLLNIVHYYSSQSLESHEDCGSLSSSGFDKCIQFPFLTKALISSIEVADDGTEVSLER